MLPLRGSATSTQVRVLPPASRLPGTADGAAEGVPDAADDSSEDESSLLLLPSPSASPSSDDDPESSSDDDPESEKAFLISDGATLAIEASWSLRIWTSSMFRFIASRRALSFSSFLFLLYSCWISLDCSSGPNASSAKIRSSCLCHRASHGPEEEW